MKFLDIKVSRDSEPVVSVKFEELTDGVWMVLVEKDPLDDSINVDSNVYLVVDHRLDLYLKFSRGYGGTWCIKRIYPDTKEADLRYVRAHDIKVSLEFSNKIK